MNTKDIKAKNGEIFTICIDDFGTEITVHQNGEMLGTISLNLIEGDLNDRDYYHITHLSLDRCSGLGVGRECLIFHRECFDAAIAAGHDEGRRSDDGSHLTGNGPGFIQKMRKEGLVVPASSDRWDRYDDDSDE